MRKITLAISSAVAIASLLLAGSPALAAAPTLSVTNGGSQVTSIKAGDELQVNTSSVIPGVGATAHQLGLSWSGQSLQLKDGSIVNPEGWDLEYSTDGTTWDTNPPADLSTVVAVRTNGDLTTSGANSFQTTAASELVVTQTSFQGTSGGDGFDLTFAGDRVFNIWHHNATGINLDCHLKATGAACYEGVLDFEGYSTSNRSSSFWNGSTSKLYAMARRTSDNAFGLTCINFADKANPVLCATPFYKLDNGAATSNDLQAATRIGNDVYLLGGNDYKLLCFNVATATPCAHNGTQLPSTQVETTDARLSSEGTKIWYITYDKFGCWDTLTNANCGGVAPQSIVDAWQYPPIPVRNTSGALLGMCIADTKLCVNGSNAVITMPAGLSAYYTAHPTPVWNTNGAGIWAEVGNKLYVSKGYNATASADVYCHDFTTDAACAGFSGASVGQEIYAIIADPSIPNCLWTNGNQGAITTFKASTGVPGCSLDYPIVQLPYTATVPRFTCADSGRVLEWDNIQFKVPTGIAASALKVTILDSNSEPIPGYVDLKTNSKGLLDLSGLTVAKTGTKPTIQTNAGNVDGALLDQLTAVVKFKADAPQLCLTLSAAPVCDGYTPAQGDTSVPNGLIQATSVTTPVSGEAFGDESVAKLAGNNTSAVCAASVVHLPYPKTDLAHTGFDFESWMANAAMFSIAGAVLLAVARRRKVTR